MKIKHLGEVIVLSMMFTGLTQAANISQWTKIDVPLRQYKVTLNGEKKTINPSCALGQPYSFHFKPGKSDKLVVYYNGGGACWDSNTCIGSLSTPKPVYVPSAEIANNPAEMGGRLSQSLIYPRMEH